MARLLLPHCCCGGLTPLPLPRRTAAFQPPPALSLPATRRALSLPASRRALSLRVAVAAPTRVVTAEDDGSRPAATAKDDPSGSGFDPAAPPPFGLAEIRVAIPKHCWTKDPWRSMGYVVRDVVIVLALAAAAARLDSWLACPVYWAAQGTMFWALFVLGHDCGQGSLSSRILLAVGDLNLHHLPSLQPHPTRLMKCLDFGGKIVGAAGVYESSQTAGSLGKSPKNDCRHKKTVLSDAF